jgi:hypothetical protein
MPMIILTIPETIQSITRPIVLDVARELFVATGIDKDVPIFFPGDTTKTFQPGTTVNEEGRAKNNYPFYERVSIEIDENYDADRMLSEGVYRAENIHIFRDDALETFMKPVYSSTDMTINFKYRAVDKVRAMRWRDDIRARLAILREQRLHELTYHYMIPPEYLYILTEIHRLREKTAGYGDTYEEYFQKHVTSYATMISNYSGSQKAWAIAETQIRVVGYFDFESTPEYGAKDSEGGEAWTVSFSYKFKYEKPIACVMTYPLMIHNEVLSTKYRPDEPAYELTQYKRDYALTSKYLHRFEKGTTKLNTLPGVALPSYDEFLPETIPHSSLRLFTTLISLDINNPNTLFNLRELGTIALLPEVLDFMVGEAPFMTEFGGSIFHLSLYRSVKLMGGQYLTVDSNLNVNSTHTLSFRDYHHVRLGLTIDLNILTEAAKLRLCNNGHVCQMLLLTLDPNLARKGKLPPIIGNNQVNRRMLQNAINEINHFIILAGRGTFPAVNYPGAIGHTVQSLFIQANRNDNADHQRNQRTRPERNINPRQDRVPGIPRRHC